MTPLTPAGQALLDAGYDELREPLTKVERQAADRALAELRREVEGLAFIVPSGRTESYVGTYGGIRSQFYPNGDGTVLRSTVLALIDKASKPEFLRSIAPACEWVAPEAVEAAWDKARELGRGAKA